MTQAPGSNPVVSMDPVRMDAHLPLRLPDDDLVPLLRKASSDDLGILVECIHKDRNEELSSVPAFQELNPRAGDNIYDGDHRAYADDIAAEIQRYCGNTISNAFRGGKGVPYIEAVRDVADRLGVNYNRNAAVDRIEREILLKVLEKAYEKMSDEEKRELLDELGVSNASGIVPSLLPVMAIQGSLAKKGLVALVLSAIVANAIVNTLVKPTVMYGAGLAASIVAPRATTMFLGPGSPGRSLPDGGLVPVRPGEVPPTGCGALRRPRLVPAPEILHLPVVLGNAAGNREFLSDLRLRNRAGPVIERYSSSPDANVASAPKAPDPTKRLPRCATASASETGPTVYLRRRPLPGWCLASAADSRPEDIGWGTAEHSIRMQASYQLAQARRERTVARRQAEVKFA